MARPITSVHVDIAEFISEVSDVSMESTENPDKALAAWTRALARCLARRDPSLHPYGAKLLAEVENYRKADSDRKRGTFPEDSTEFRLIPAHSVESKDVYNRSEQIRSDQSKRDKMSEKSDVAKQSAAGATALMREVLDYLNSKTGKRFRPGAAAHRMISARMVEGYTLPEFKKVIDNKCADWLLDPAMEQFLRPDTLFRPSKMDGYLNQKTSGAKRPMNGRKSEHDVPDLEFLQTGGAV